MINEKLEKAFNDQINKEFYSAYLYLAMKSKFAEMNLNGFVNWFDVQVQEEQAHGMGMYDYVLERGGKIELGAIDKPEVKSERINALMDVAEETKDRAALSFLDWYLKEQVEEESNVGGLLATLKLIGEDKKALLMLDKDLSTRVFNPPVIG